MSASLLMFVWVRPRKDNESDDPTVSDCAKELFSSMTYN